MTKEALKLALKALETSMYPQQKQLQAITAIKKSLAQPEQEPVGSLSVRYHRGCKSMTNTDFDYNGDLPEGDYELYTTPPPCPTCEALARTVMLDQTGRDA